MYYTVSGISHAIFSKEPYWWVCLHNSIDKHNTHIKVNNFYFPPDILSPKHFYISLTIEKFIDMLLRAEADKFDFLKFNNKINGILDYYSKEV